MAERTTLLAEAQLDRGGRTAWGAIIAGTVVALAVFALLTLLGIGIGFAGIDPRSADPLGASPTIAPIYLFLSQLVALAAGGYVAGRLAGVLHTVGAALHGVTVWALTTILSIYFATVAASGLFSAVTSALSTVGGGAANAVQAVIPDDFELPNLTDASVGFDQLPEGVQQTLRENGVTPENFQQEAQEALRSVVSQQEQQQLTAEAQEAATDVLQSPGDIGQDIQQFTDEIFGAGGVLSEEDRTQALQVLQERFGITEEEAQAYVDQVQARAEEVQAQAGQAIEEARAAATEAADQAADAASTAGFLAFFASLIGLAAAAGGAVAGRVKPVDLPR